MLEKTSSVPDLLYEYLLDPRYLFYWITAVVLIITVYFILRKIKRNKVSSFSIAFIVGYFFMVYSYTVLSRPTGDYTSQLIPLWSYYDLIFHHMVLQILWISLNLAMLFPIGFLLPLGIKNIKWNRVLIIAFVLSYFVEFSQLLFHKGTFELFDDPINNVIGCMIGYFISSRLIKWKRYT